MDKGELNLSKLQAFQWDAGNVEKNWLKHRVDFRECEEVFFNEPLFVAQDLSHSQGEKRYFALGITDRGRRLSIIFTMRGAQIRVISARDQSKKQRELYEKQSR